MKRNLLITKMLMICMLIGSFAYGQLSLNSFNTHQINFDETVDGVNNGAYMGSGFTTNPIAGELSADAWEISGLSDGSKLFGVVNNSGDHARGNSSGGVTTGGFYGFDVGFEGMAFGFQATGGDFTPGSITLKIENNTGEIANSVRVTYTVFTYNDQDRSNTLNFSHSEDNTTFADEIIADYSSPILQDVSPLWVATDQSIEIVLGSPLADGGSYYLRWSSDDDAGGGSRDEFAIDNINVQLGKSTCGMFIDEVVEDETCSGDSDGFAKLFVNGGTFPYNYLWSNGKTTFDANDLTADVYAYTITDAGVCNIEGSIVIEAPTSISVVDITTVTESCFRYDGEAHVTITGGVEPYSYTWYDLNNFETYSNSADWTSATGGDYGLYVEDKCFSSIDEVVTIPSNAMQISVSFGMTSSCGASDGVMNTTVTGGDEPYLYSWSNGTNLSSNTDAAAIYFITVTDDNGCKEIEGNGIFDPGAPTVSVSMTDVICYGDNDGTGMVDIVGTNPPYDVTWGKGINATPFATTESISGLSPELYLVTVTDALGCKSFNGDDVNGPDQLFDPSFYDGSFYMVEGVSCYGESDGSATVQVWENGGSGFPYDYEWSTGFNDMGSFNDESFEFGLAPGDYSVTITDAGGCVQVRDFVINEPAEPGLSINSSDDLCGNYTGWAMAVATGGTPGYFYNWDTGSNDQVLNNISGGSYSVTVEDDNGCAIGVESVTITSITEMISDVSTTDATCGNSDGTASVGTTGGTTPYSYLWSNGSTTTLITGLSAGTALITVEDNNGCRNVEGNFVANPGAPTVTLAFTSVTCPGAEDGTINTTVTGTGPFEYTWYNFESNSIVGTTANLTGLSGGAYLLTVTDDQLPSCQTSDFAEIEENNTIEANSYIVQPNCWDGANDNNFNGAVYLSPEGGDETYVFDWGSGPTSQDNIIGLGEEVVSVTITDGMSCSIYESYTITAVYDEVIGSVNVVDDLCATGDGAYEASATGGNGTYGFYWDNMGVSNATLDNLSVGDQDGVSIGDEDFNCYKLYPQPAISGPVNPLTASVSTTDATCGQSNGTATVEAIDATPPYTYVWNSGQTATGVTTFTITGLNSGVALVTVYDANSCEVLEGDIVNNPGAPTLVGDGVDATCFGGNDGEMSVEATGGLTPYDYYWADQAGNFIGTTATVTGLDAQTLYLVTVTGDDGCSASEGGFVDSPDKIEMDVFWKENPSCNNYSDGEAMIGTNGGVGFLSYNWSSGEINSNPTNLSSGTNSVTITDQVGCFEIFEITLSNPSAITVSTSAYEANCGSPDGAASATAIGGKGGFDYLWSNGHNGSFADNLLAGTYGVTASDINGCAESETVFVNNLNGVMVTVTSDTEITCNGASDGQVYAAITGGSSPFTYNWSNGSTATGASSLIAGLYEGSYNVTVSDNNGCLAFDGTVLEAPSVLNLTIFSTNVNCNAGNDGQADAFVTGGTSPYAYSWDDDLTQTTMSAMALTQGEYSVTVVDDNACSISNSTTISEPTALTLTISSTDETTAGDNDGTASITVTGGNSMYGYLWSNGATTSSLAGLSPAEYTVTVDDNDACDQIESVTVNGGTVLCNLTLTIFSTNVNCNAGNDGQADAFVTGGTSPYTYSWDDDLNQSTISAMALTQGEFSVTVMDDNACSISKSTTISEPTALTLTVSSTDETTAGDNDGTASITVTGGNSMYGYLWSNGETTPSIAGLTPMAYSVTVDDNDACDRIESVTVNEGTVICSLTLTESSMDESCGEEDGTATITATGTGTSFTYTWDDGRTTSMIDNLAAMTYFVTVNSNDGCVESTSVTIAGTARVDFELIAVDPTCGESDGSVSISITSGISPYNYSWTDINGNTVGGNSSAITGLSFGGYFVTVSDDIGCSKESGTGLSEAGAPSVTVTSGDVTCNGGSDGYVEATISGGTAPFTYAWGILNVQTSSTTVLSETGSSIIYLGANSDDEMYMVTVSGADGCSGMEGTSIDQPDAITVSVSSTSVTSAGANDGTATVSASGGYSTFTYAWSNSTNDNIATGLAGGTYTVTVTDGNGCTESGSIFVAEDGVEPTCGLSIALSSTSVTTNGGNDGTATVTTSGELGSVTYAWSVSGSGSSINGLIAGTYSVTVTDDVVAGCTATESFTITEPAVVSTTINEIAETSSVVTYPNPNDGNFTVAINGNGVYSIAVLNVIGQAIIMDQIIVNEKEYYSVNLDNVQSGIYFVKVTEDNFEKVIRVIVNK